MTVSKSERRGERPLTYADKAYPVMDYFYAPYLQNTYLNPFLARYPLLEGTASSYSYITQGTHVEGLRVFRSDRYLEVHFQSKSTTEKLKPKELYEISKLITDINQDRFITTPLIWIPPGRKQVVREPWDPNLNPETIAYKYFPNREFYYRANRAQVIEVLQQVLGEEWQKFDQAFNRHWDTIGFS